ncbi:unnamed protein product [Urochloa decumbens]|uniref:Uncharacterized protein n=1 Tax=Urochloa decumbens TaxID=240449 RepID=A0ABC9DGI3_9POAL
MSSAPQDIDKSKANGNHSELSYDPRCGMSKEEFEWKCSQAEMVHQRMPKVLHKLNVELEKMRNHFNDDSKALERWDEYMHDVNYAFSRKLPYFLCSRVPNSVLYKQLMRRKAPSKPSVLYEKVKQATRKMVPRVAMVATIAAAFASGVAVGPALRKQERTQET